MPVPKGGGVETVSRAKDVVYCKNLFKLMTALQQAGGGLPPKQRTLRAAPSNPESLVSANTGSVKLEEYIILLLRQGYNDADIKRMLNIDDSVLSFYKRRLEKIYNFKKRNEKFIGELRTFEEIKDLVAKQNPVHFARYEYFKKIMGHFYAFLGMSKAQIKIIMGVKDATCKSYRQDAVKFKFAPRHIDMKYSTLEWRLVESMFVANYARIGGDRVMISMDPLVAHETYVALQRGLENHAPESILPFRMGFDNFVDLAKSFRQGRVCLEYCDICNCYHAKRYDPEKKLYAGGCPFCEFRDIYVTHFLPSGNMKF